MEGQNTSSRVRSEYAMRDFLGDLYNAMPSKGRLRLILMSVLRLVSSLGSFVAIWITGMIVDFFIGYQSGGSLKEFYVLLVVLLVASIGQAFLRFWSKFYIQEAGMLMQRNLRLKGFSKLLELDLLWHGKERTGNKIQRINSGASAALEFMRLFSNELARFMVDFGGVLIVFAAINIRYTIFAVLFGVVFILVEQRFQKPIYETTRRLHKHNEHIAGKAYEAGNNIISIKSLGLQRKFNSIMNKEEGVFAKHWQKQKVASQNKAKSVHTMISIGQVLFLLFLGFDIVNGNITPGDLVVFSGYFGMYLRSMGNYSSINLNIARFKVKLSRLNEVLKERVQTFDSNGAKLIPKNWKQIDFLDVSFDYEGKKVLKDFDLSIKRNEKIGVVGTSGAGKSTVAKLLLRLYKLNKGLIAVDTLPIESVSRNSLRKFMTVVPQDQELFNLSLEENITLQSKTKHPALLKKAMRIAQLDKLIKDIPYGVKTIVGEKGYRLSGGERQRVGIARAIYRNAPVLILDEATASLDSTSELAVQKRLDALKDVTLLVIAHRLSTLKNMDRIIVLHRGKVVEQGSFKALIAKRGRFYDLYKKQELA